MIKVNFTDGVEVITSSTHLYQWDSNQKITISGLNVANASVHFTNKKRNDAIVVNGTRNNNSLVADIPNILLEDDLDIIAYVHVVASNKGNTIKVVKIPKIARQKPSDYQFTENVEIMTFERLQNDFNDLADECHEVLDNIQRELITVDGEGAINDGGYSIIKPRRATTDEWENADSILADGEMAVEVPNDGVGSGISKIKIGDGETAWNELPYAVDNVQGDIDLLKGTIGYTRKNLLKNINITSAQTKDGVTCTPNADGSFTLTGKPTKWTFFNINYQENVNTMKKGEYILSGADSWKVALMAMADGEGLGTDQGDGARFTVGDSTHNMVRIYVDSTADLTGGVTVYPMVRYASIEDNTYEPYVPSIEENFGVITPWTPKGNILDDTRNYYIKTKNSLKIWFCVELNAEINTSNGTFNLCDNILQTFGVSSHRKAWGTISCLNYMTPSLTEAQKYPNALICANNNVLKVEYGGATIYNKTSVYGFIEFGING